MLPTVNLQINRFRTENVYIIPHHSPEANISTPHVAFKDRWKLGSWLHSMTVWMKMFQKFYIGSA